MTMIPSRNCAATRPICCAWRSCCRRRGSRPTPPGSMARWAFAAPDHLPLIGAMPDVDAARLSKAALHGAQLTDLPRRAGLYCASGYGSRGLVWAALAGEMLASLIEGEPLPLEGDLADALDPGRFVLKQARRRIL